MGVTRRSKRCAPWLATILLAGCTNNVGQLELRLLRSPVAAEEPLTNVAAFLRVRVDGPDGRFGPVQFPVAAGQGTLGDVPTGSGQVVTVEGLGPEGNAVSRGRTGPLVIGPSENVIEIFVGRLERFSQTPRSEATVGLAVPRAFHSATELVSGDLLLVGGVSERWHPESGSTAPSPLRSVERLDGNSLRFARIDCGQAGACPTHARVGHTTTRLPSGNVLVAGGQDGAKAVKELEVFYAATGTFLVGVQPLKTARANHAAALRGERAWLAGGRFDAGNLLTNLVETYDKGKLEGAPALTMPRRDFAMVRLDDNTLFISGGFDDQGLPLASTELLSPEATQWRRGPALKVARGQHSATLLADGDVLLIGGLTAGGQATGSIERFTVRDEHLAELAKLQLPRWAHTATQLRDGRVLVVGGFGLGTTGQPTRLVEEITLVSTTVLNIKQPFQLREPRAGHTATLLGSGWLLVAGGASIVCQAADPPVCEEAPSSSAEVFVY